MTSVPLGGDAPDVSQIRMFCTGWQSDGAFEAAALREAAEYFADENADPFGGNEQVDGSACDPVVDASVSSQTSMSPSVPMPGQASCSQTSVTTMLASASTLPQDLPHVARLPAGPNVNSDDFV